MFFIKAWVVFTATAAITTTAATKRRPMLKSDSCQDFPFRPAALASDAIDWAVTLREQSWRQMLESRKPLLSKYVFFLICLGFSGLRWFPLYADYMGTADVWRGNTIPSVNSARWLSRRR